MMNVRSLHIIIFIMAALFVLGLSATPPATPPNKSSSASPVRSASGEGFGSGRKASPKSEATRSHLNVGKGLFSQAVQAFKQGTISEGRRRKGSLVSRRSASVVSEGPSDSVNASNGLEEGYLEGHRFSDDDSDGIDSSSRGSASGVVEVPASDQLSDKDVEQGAQRKGAPGRASFVTLPDDTVEAVGDSHDAEAASLVKTDPVSRYSSKLALVSSLFLILSLGREAAKLRGLTVTRRLQLVQEGFDQELVSSWPKAFGLAMKRIFTAGHRDAKLIRLASALLLGSSATWAATQN
jgi:hypothetical protein